MTTAYYKDRIDELFTKMFSIRRNVLPANQGTVQNYLNGVWKKVSTLTSSFGRAYQLDFNLQQRFRSYVDSEETRLKKELEIVEYDIDAMDTLSLITGPGRIEKVSHSCYPRSAVSLLRPLLSVLCPFCISFFKETLRSFVCVALE